MSCRVLKRGVEQLLCNYVVEKACELGASSLHGIYVPTAKNAMVCNHYKSLGFTCIGEDQNGAVHWHLDLTSYKPFNVEIEVVEEY
jgi:predicted enzyme involved in methoxymalonyl-ACP biosynthesis